MHLASRPRRLIGVMGTHTEVGKTWLTARVLEILRSRDVSVAARKPVQSFESGTGPTDAQLLSAASGEDVQRICPAHRCYPLAMAPPMAADALDRERIELQALIDEIQWPDSTDIGFVETVGGARSPLAHDGDSVHLVQRLGVDEVLLVADAGLGTINAVRLTLPCLAPLPVTVFLNRFDAGNDLHCRNRQWLSSQDGIEAVWEPRSLAERLARMSRE